jgi:hypothetical protein
VLLSPAGNAAYIPATQDSGIYTSPALDALHSVCLSVNVEHHPLDGKAAYWALLEAIRTVALLRAALAHAPACMPQVWYLVRPQLPQAAVGHHSSTRFHRQTITVGCDSASTETEMLLPVLNTMVRLCTPVQGTPVHETGDTRALHANDAHAGIAACACGAQTIHAHWRHERHRKQPRARPGGCSPAWLCTAAAVACSG